MKYLIPLPSIMFLFACNSGSNTVEPNSNGQDTTLVQADTIAVTQQEYIFYLPGCPEEASCTYMSVIKVELDGAATDELKASVSRYMDTWLFSGANTTNSLQAMADSFFADYLEITEEFAREEYALPWAYEVVFEKATETDSTISFSDSYYSFTGGAHGIYGTGYINFIKKTGRQIKFADLFQMDKLAGLTATAEDHFRKMSNLTADQTFDEAGFFIEDDSFYLSQNFLLKQDSITFVYSIYEIAPYAAGEIALTIPTKKLKPYLRPSFAYLVDEVEL